MRGRNGDGFCYVLMGERKVLLCEECVTVIVWVRGKVKGREGKGREGKGSVGGGNWWQE